jgi:hypothetical protein
MSRRRQGATAALPQQGVLTPAQQRTIVKLVKRLGPSWTSVTSWRISTASTSASPRSR